jgi:hypothetical protein
MADPATPKTLPPDAAMRLTDFARSCRAAARAVSLYPHGHPAIGSSLARLSEATAKITEAGPFKLDVRPRQLAVDGAVAPRPDPAIAELADVLHGHLIAGLTVNAGADADSWRTLLLLLARAPEEVRADGGIAHLWATAGGPSLEVREVDYAEILREKQGLAATIDEIVSAALAGPQLELDDGAMRALLEIIGEPAKLDELMRKLQEATADRGTDVMTAAFLSLLKGLTEYVARTSPDKLDTVFTQVGHAAGQLSAEAMLNLLAQKQSPDAMAGTVDVVAGVTGRMSDRSVAKFVAGSVVAEKGATGRLAQAFQALVPDRDRQRQLLALAEQDVAASPIGKDDMFAELWGRVESMLASYTDKDFVSSEYGRELTHARTRAIEVEQLNEDPPERVATWHASVSDAALRSLDHQLLVDLLAIEAEAPRWRDIAETVVAHADDLVRVGYFDQAWQLAEAIVEQSAGRPDREPHARTALAQFGSGKIMKHVAVHLRGATDESFERFTKLCHGIGLPVIAPLAEALAGEQDARARRRLRDILIGFGAQGRESFRQLMNAPNWEVRRTAAFLLREFGGGEGLKELIPLLSDPEPLVQREAIQGLVLNGSEEAGKILLSALGTASERTRQALVNEMVSMRDDRAAPLLSYLLRHMDRRSLPQVYMAAIEALGNFGGKGAVAALAFALQGSELWAPLRTRRIRSAAAGSLRRIGTPDALDTLKAASSSGPRGVRAAARAALEGS